jgi:hypothetical protein
MKPTIMQFSSACNYFIPLRYKYSTKYPVLKYSLFIFFSYQRPGLAPVINKQ